MAKKPIIRKEKKLTEFFKKKEEKKEVKPEEIVEKIRPVIKEEIEKAISEVIRIQKPKIVSTYDLIKKLESEYNIVFYPWELKGNLNPKVIMLLAFIKALYKELYGTQQINPRWIFEPEEAYKEARRLYNYIKEHREDLLEKYRPLIQEMLSLVPL